jgi:hypothetical protein
MSYKPPPSFSAEEAGGCSKEACENPRGSMLAGKSRQKTRGRKAWAPSFVVGDVPESAKPSKLETLQVSRGLSLPTNADFFVDKVVGNSSEEKISLSLPTRRAETINRNPSRSNKIPSTSVCKPRATVAWNEHLVVVDPNIPRTSASSTDDGDNAKSTSLVSRQKHSQLVDHATLQSRLEWSKLLIHKAFKPYTQIICDADDDLPDLEAFEEMEDDDYWDENEDMRQIRDDMLDDTNLTEREVICFFEGFRLFQIKVNSLKTQLQGAKTMHRLATRSAFAPRSTIAARSMVISRDEFQKTTHLKPKFATGFSNTTDRGSSSALSGIDEIAPIASLKKAAPILQSQKVGKDVEKSKAPVTNTGKENNMSCDEDDESAPKSRKVRSVKSLRVMSIQRIRRETHTQGSSDIRKLLEELQEAENRQKKLEKQLAQAGVVIAEDIPYAVAKEMVTNIAARMTKIGSSDVADKELREEYFKLEQDMEKYSAALQLTDEWTEEQEELERDWEVSIAADNEEALKKLRRHMPVDVRNQSEAALATHHSPNGKVLPRAIARKFKRTNCLQLLRVNPDDMFPMHPSTLENMRVTGLTLTERRALYHHLREVGPRWKSMGADKMMERKWIWFNMMKSNFKESVDSWQRHVAEYGPPGNHPYATRGNPHGGCPLLGKQCPLRADKQVDYDGDYGHPVDAQYFKAEVRKSDVDNVSKPKQEAAEALREKKSLDRNSALKKHHKGKILQVSLANGSCESMDDVMDRIEAIRKKWAEQRLMDCKDPAGDRKKNLISTVNDSLNELKLSISQFAERSGMQLTGKRDASMEKLDLRSMIEIALCEEVVETAKAFFRNIEERTKELKVKDGRLKSTIKHLDSLLAELHERNTKTMQTLGEARPSWSRPLKTSWDFANEIAKENSRAEKVAASQRSSDRTVEKGIRLEGIGGGKRNGGILDTIVRDRCCLVCFFSLVVASHFFVTHVCSRPIVVVREQMAVLWQQLPRAAKSASARELELEDCYTLLAVRCEASH